MGCLGEEVKIRKDYFSFKTDRRVDERGCVPTEIK